MQDSKRDTDVKNRLLDYMGEDEGGTERKALKHVYYHRESRWPVQVWYMKQGTQSWCSGTNQRDRVGREVGRGHSGWGDTCIPMADSYGCMAKTTIILWSNWPPIKIN